MSKFDFVTGAPAIRTAITENTEHRRNDSLELCKARKSGNLNKLELHFLLCVGRVVYIGWLYITSSSIITKL